MALLFNYLYVRTYVPKSYQIPTYIRTFKNHLCNSSTIVKELRTYVYALKPRVLYRAYHPQPLIVRSTPALLMHAVSSWFISHVHLLLDNQTAEILLPHNLIIIAYTNQNSHSTRKY